MIVFDLLFISDAEPFPNVSTQVEMPSMDMAYNYASKLLQSTSNTMFHTVQVHGPESLEIRTCELVTTRGTKERK